MMEWYDYKGYGGGEWDRPVNTDLLNELKVHLATRPHIFDDCLATPSGTQILGIHNVYIWNGMYRVLYSYANKEGTAPGTAIIRFLDQDIHMPLMSNLKPIISITQTR